MARVNINIAITAMVTEKLPQENHSSTVCESEYEFGTSSTKLSSTFFGETDGTVERGTFDWTNRQSGLMLGTRAVRTYFIDHDFRSLQAS